MFCTWLAFYSFIHVGFSHCSSSLSLLVASILDLHQVRVDARVTQVRLTVNVEGRNMYIIWGCQEGNKTVQPLHSWISDKFFKSNPTSYFLNVYNSLPHTLICAIKNLSQECPWRLKPCSLLKEKLSGEQRRQILISNNFMTSGMPILW